MRIAIDFDGTLVEHEYPGIGKEIPGAFDVLLELQEVGHQLILWTYRDGDLLDEAVAFCEEKGIRFHAVNENFPGEEFRPGKPRLIEADVFIDDRNLGGLSDWEDVRKELVEKHK